MYLLFLVWGKTTSHYFFTNMADHCKDIIQLMFTKKLTVIFSVKRKYAITLRIIKKKKYKQARGERSSWRLYLL